MANLVHPEISKILNGQLRPEPLYYRTRHGCGRPSTKGVSTNSLVLADALEGEEPRSGGEGREGGEQHADIPSVAVLSMVTVPPTDELILANRDELER